MKSLFLLYHELRPAPSTYSYAIDSPAFEQHCELFAGLQRSSGESLVPQVTFDDGHRSNYEFALPILERYGIRAHFFITAGWIGTRAEYMSWDEVRALHAAGHTVGAHGSTHTLLTHCNTTQLQHELSDPRQTLEHQLSAPVTTMSLPGGRSNRRVLGACWDAGYTEVFTSVPRAEPETRAPRSTIGRLNIRGSMTTAWLENVLRPQSGALRNLELQEQIKSAARSVLGDTAYAKLWAIINRQESQPDHQGAAAE